MYRAKNIFMFHKTMFMFSTYSVIDFSNSENAHRIFTWMSYPFIWRIDWLKKNKYMYKYNTKHFLNT